MAKRNRYILLTIICICLIILMENSFTPPLGGSKLSFNLNPEKVARNPQLVIFVLLISLFYIGIIFSGAIQLLIFAGRKLQNKPLIDLQEKPRPFTLPEEEASKLLFLIFAFLSLTYSVPGLLYHLQWKVSLSFFIWMNMLLEVVVIFLVYTCLKIKILGFSVQKKYTALTLRMYTATLPLFLAAALLNYLIAESLGAKNFINPALQLLLLLKSKLSLWLLALQIIALGPLAEELFFRGFLYKMARTRFGFLASSITVSLLFSLLHKDPYTLMPIFILSLGLCYLYEKTQNIYSPFLFHALFNMVNLSFLVTIKNFF